MNNDVHFSHKNDAWATPQAIFDELNREFAFELDACASLENAKCARHYTEADNGLEQPWAARNWCNPPYSEIKLWVTKARREQLLGNMTVMLIPARTDTAIFHDSIHNKPDVEIRFLRGRLIFGTDAYWAWVWEQEYLNGKKNSLYKKYGKKNTAPFPSMVVIFKA